MSSGKHVRVKSTVDDILSDGGSSFEDLRDEMDAWRDSLEDKFRSTEKYERVSEAADALGSAEVSQRCEALRDALELYGEGQEGQAACSTHVSGTACAACGWDGVPISEPYKVRVEPRDPPTTDYSNPNGPKIIATVRTARTLRHYHLGEERVMAEELRRLEEIPPKLTLPKMRLAKVHIDADERFAELLAKEVEYTEFQPYKGRSCSRSSRLGNATAAVLAAVEATRSLVDQMAESSTGEALVLDEIGSALEELETAVAELDGIEFPGMYG